MKRKPFTWRKGPSHHGSMTAKGRWKLKSIRMNETQRDALAIEFHGASGVNGVIQVTRGGMQLYGSGSKPKFLNWVKVAEALRKADEPEER